VSALKPLLLTVATGGGFTFETTRLLQQIGDAIQPVYLRTDKGGLPGEHGLPAGASYVIPQFATVTKPALWRSAYGFLLTFLIAGWVLLRMRIPTVVVIGCSHSVPVLLAACLLNRKTIYIESLTRSDKLSNTGMMVRRAHLARRFIVQWPHLILAYPGTILGTIL